MTDAGDLKPWQQHTAEIVPRVTTLGATSFKFVLDRLAVLPERRSRCGSATSQPSSINS